jgi:hypothetical protein
MKTSVQWMKGETGTGGTYTFNPKPFLVRSTPLQRKTELAIPNMDGTIIQTLGLASRTIEIQGVILVKNPNFDNLVELKKALEDGIGTGVGQLHIISSFGQSNSKHVYYKGIPSETIQWSEQKNMTILDYALTIVCPDPTEYIYVPPGP